MCVAGDEKHFARKQQYFYPLQNVITKVISGAFKKRDAEVMKC
jgi:hypothetical protein